MTTEAKFSEPLVIPKPTIEQALLALASRPEPQGFSQRDLEFGRSLAQQIRAGRQMSPKQLAAGYRMLARYDVQLRYGFAIEYARITAPPPPPPPDLSLRKITAAGEDYAVAFPMEGSIVAAIRAFPDGRKWDSTGNFWRVTNTPANAQGIAALITAFKFSVSAEAQTLIDLQAEAIEAQRTAIRAELEASIAASSDFNVPGLGLDLYPFQRAGVEYAFKHKRTFIADQMGLGKSPQALATLKALGAFPAVLVVPASLKLTWQAFIKAWLPGTRSTIITGNAPLTLHDSMPALFALDASADITIINYDVLESWVPTLKALGIKAVVFDECHMVKNIGAKRTKAAIEVAKGLDCVLLLTGTPVLNKPEELLAQLTIMGRITEFGGPKKFRATYVKAPAPDLRSLNRALRASCYVRRTKDQVLKDLPPKQRDVIPFELTNMKEYIEAEGGLIEYLRGVDMMRSKRANFAIEMGKIEALKQLALAGIIDQAVDWIRGFLDDSDEKLITFGLHHACLDRLIEEFPRAARILGTEKDMAIRQQEADQFQRDPECRLMVGAMGPHAAASPAGIGWTLTAASTVAFLELGWTPGHHDQCEDRAHRIGQKDTVNVHYLIAPATIQERLIRIIDAKRLVVDATTEGDAQAQKTAILADLIADLRGYDEDPREWDVKA